MEKRRKLLDFACKCFIVVSLLALFLIAGKSLAETNPNNRLYADFVGYYRSAKMVLSDDRSKIYDRELQLKYFNSLGAAQESNEFIYSQNPPFFFILLAPFALLPLNFSFKIWIALSVLSTWAATFFMMKNLHGSKASDAMFFALAGLLSAPGWICISVGQMSWFMTALFALYFGAMWAKKEFLCGLAIALSTSKFQYVFILGTALLGQMRWKAIAWALASELVLLGISAFVIGVDNVINYPSLLINAETTKDYSGVFPEYMISMRGVLSLFLDRHAALLSSSVLMFASLFPLIWLWFHSKKAGSKNSFVWASSITVCTALLVSAHTHIYDDLLLLVPAALSLPLLFMNRTTELTETNTAISAVEKLWSLLILSFPYLSWILLIFCNSFDAVRRTPFAFLNLVLLLCALYFFSREKQSKQKGDA